MLHNSTWSIEKHAACPPAYMQLLTEGSAQAASAASAPPLSQSLNGFNEQQPHLQPLPPGWELLVDSSGRPYYGNPSLRITQYQHPALQPALTHGAVMLQAQQPPVHQAPHAAGRVSFASSHIEMQEVGAAAQLSPRSQWQRCTDAYGRSYVLNTMTGETKWEYGN